MTCNESGSGNADDPRKQTLDDLRQSEKQYRLVIENSHDIIYATNPEGVFTFVSPSWTLQLGHPVSEVIGKPGLAFIHPDDLEKCRALRKEIFETKRHISGIECRVRHADGTWRWHVSNAAPVTNESGDIFSIVVYH